MKYTVSRKANDIRHAIQLIRHSRSAYQALQAANVPERPLLDYNIRDFALALEGNIIAAAPGACPSLWINGTEVELLLSLEDLADEITSLRYSTASGSIHFTVTKNEGGYTVMFDLTTHTRVRGEWVASHDRSSTLLASLWEAGFKGDAEAMASDGWLYLYDDNEATRRIAAAVAADAFNMERGKVYNILREAKLAQAPVPRDVELADLVEMRIADYDDE